MYKPEATERGKIYAASEEASKKVSTLYLSGTRCDKACLQVLQKAMGLPEKKWNWLGYQILMSDRADSYTCKSLAAGCTAIAVEIINKSRGNLSSSQVMKGYGERVTRLIGEFVGAFGHHHCSKLLGFDPMKYDQYSEEIQEEIEKGDWMDKCCKYMEFIVSALLD